MPACQAQGYRSVLSDLEFFTARMANSIISQVEPLPEDVWQLWGADIGAGRWRVDMMVDRGSLDMWVYKRDPSLTLPRAKAIRATAGGIRYLAPHIVLLFKARHAREKDDQDFRNALPRLESTEIRPSSMVEALHPGHA